MKKLLLQLHLCLGLAASLFLIVLSLTGAVMVFENELNRAVNPHLLTASPGGRPLPWEQVRRDVERQEPAWRVQRMYMPATDSDSTYVRLASRSTGVTREIYVNQYTGAILGRKELGNQLIWKIHELHINLAEGYAGSQVVAAASVALLFLSLSGLYLWWPRRIFRFRMSPQAGHTNYDLHRVLGFWSSLAMFLFAVTGINLHIQTGGTLFNMMDAKASAVNLPGHGATADEMIAAASEAVPGARPMRISFWGGKRPVLVQLRFPEDHTPAGRTNVTLDPRTGRVLTVESSRTAPVVFTALIEWNREIHTGTIFGMPSRIAAAVFSLLLAALAITGPLIWLNRRAALARGRRMAAERRAAGVLKPAGQTQE